MKIALCGIGTVGGGVVKVLAENQAQFQAKYKEDLVISHVLTRDPDKVDRLGLESAVFTDRVEDIYEADIDLVVEVMGGVDFAYQVIRQSLSQGRHVVTANKDLLALHIDELQALANEKGVSLLYEASVAGGIPIINGVQVGLAANQISGVMGILNGTTNYMLSHMTQDGWTYDHALSVAQEKGYAEADPTNDVGGFDAARKITLLSRLAYDTRVDFHQEVGKCRIRRLVTHIFPALLPSAQGVLDIQFGLFGIDFASLAVNGRTQINLIYAVIHDITADKLDTELVQILGSLNFGHFSLADLIAQTRRLIADF